jgi:hypothetical protein
VIRSDPVFYLLLEREGRAWIASESEFQLLGLFLEFSNGISGNEPPRSTPRT